MGVENFLRNFSKFRFTFKGNKSIVEVSKESTFKTTPTATTPA